MAKTDNVVSMRPPASTERPSRGQDKTPSVGSILPTTSCRILEEIGQGAFGVVYLAKDLEANRLVAIKHLRDQEIPNLLERFEREEAVMRLVEHENIVRVFDRFFIEDYGHFIMMEHIDGESLDTLIDESCGDETHLDLPLVLDVMEGLLLACRVLEEKGIVHRDIKPENVMVLTGRTGVHRTKLMDFGVAKVLGEKASPGMHAKLTQRCIQVGKLCMIGSPEFMAPEQIQSQSQGEVTPATDIYALGALLYCMLVGEPPFTAELSAENPLFNILSKQLSNDPPDARDLRPKVPEKLALAIRKAMAKKQADRFLSADEFLAVIHDVRKDLAVADEPTDSDQDPSSIGDLIESSIAAASSVRIVASSSLISQTADTERPPPFTLVRTDPKRTRNVRLALVAVTTALLILLVLWLSSKGWL